MLVKKNCLYIGKEKENIKKIQLISCYRLQTRSQTFPWTTRYNNASHNIGTNIFKFRLLFLHPVELDELILRNLSTNIVN